ncbi:extracellular catalytic domain type 1 short-chain-length polyhydroxyalkanoate depolymerase [Allopusillimonas ginsengisoli]|uniref:extracellular catalytic domain type 1 short-chain-length polyhydroxyalkanoate depolymerase n=1 Tax=Allopusillimonas ginsengisoli TaxID=453575 RepID=UPI00102044A9|nr:PHB depolymerase family esterase [Allopusillimonas ginsengisoli]TEA79467.1 PHB depolymerase family esterase [Allopusillimonas ginsengisoli]
MKRYRYANAQGERNYKLFVPKRYGDQPLPLIIMLHGCKQDAADFALGTGMNVLAEQNDCLVAYPIQPRRASRGKCWNWYQPQHQQRDFGEPAIIAGITLEIIANFNVDAARVYVAGLSAGGAMAAVMVHTYPDIYAAAGVHSGLPYQRASGVLSALGAMKIGIGAPRGLSAISTHAPKRPMIVFHGDLDMTVHPSNGWELLHEFEDMNATVSEETVDQADGRRSTLRTIQSSDGIDAEHWVVHGAPHAWAGGNESGSYTDGSGPDASAEMLRFFLAHTLEPTLA